MLSIFNRFVDWFLMREEGEDADAQNPAQLMQGISDVNVLIAEPDGKFASDEAKAALLQSIIGPLNERPGLSLRLINKSLQRSRKGSLSDQIEASIGNGRKWLEKEKCDLLMWGEVSLEDQAVRWYFLSAVEGEANLGMPAKLENLLVPFDPEKATLDVLYAAIFAATSPHHSTQALKIGEYLLGAVDPLTKLSSGLTSRKTSPAAKTSAMGMCAVVLANVARRAQELGWFDPAVKAFDTWESLVDKDKTPIEWALVKNHQGWLYDEMTNHEDDDQALEHIEKAIAIFEEVCTVLNEKQHPLEWASVQMRIAGTCSKIGRKMNDSDYLQKAARYYKKSMNIYTQAAYPLNWADAMSRMAKTMMLHGQMMKGAQSLEQAGVAFQAVLKVYTEEKYPALWASTQNNLGATLFALAKRDPSTPQWINHALICFDGARRYYEETGKTQMVHVIDKNISKAQDLKDQIEEELASDLLN
ncbi:MAG: hypothetical protein HWE30_07630 [Methylocystaceae bacterium]|nr:hypothetical protein [Methylocystaceae bacterium]